MAVHDRVFVPILALAVVGGRRPDLPVSRAGWTGRARRAGGVVGLLVLLTIRCYILLPTLHAESLAEPV